MYEFKNTSSAMVIKNLPTKKFIQNEEIEKVEKNEGKKEKIYSQMYREIAMEQGLNFGF